MVALNVSSLGYAGTITEITGRDYFNRIGSSLYGVAGSGDLKVTITSGDRMLLAAQGIAWGHNIVDTVASDATLQLDAVASGDRWDTIVLRRDAQTATTTLHAVKGNSTRALASLTTGGMSHPDQPIALARVTADSVAVQEVVDLRCWAHGGGLLIADDLARSYLNLPGTVLRLASGRTWLANSSGAWVQLPGARVVLAPNGINSAWTVTGDVGIDYASRDRVTVDVNIARTSNMEYAASTSWTTLPGVIPSQARRSSARVTVVSGAVIGGNFSYHDISVRVNQVTGDVEFRRSTDWVWPSGATLSINLSYFL